MEAQSLTIRQWSAGKGHPMSRIISALLVAISSAVFAVSVWAQADKPLELVPGAPDRYIVVPGDTLWGIAHKYVADPYRWPDLWRLNSEQVKNPQRIYPGQVLVLKHNGEQPYLDLETVRIEPRQIVSPLVREIPTIPQKTIQPFLSRPLIVEPGVLDAAPRIVALQEDRLLIGPGANIYVTGIKDSQKGLFSIYRPGKSLVNPATKEALGREAVYLGTAKLVRSGEPAIFEVVNAVSEIGIGDDLVAVPGADVLSYVPHAPKGRVDASVLSVLGDQLQGGALSIVALSRGARDGMETGHVLALHQAGVEVVDRFKDHNETFKLPDERYGLVFVFRVFDRVSYALVMEAKHEVVAGDTVQTP
jgi:LysM repeat protein